MVLTLKIIYWENDATVTREVSMGDTNGMDNLPKNNVIFMIFSTKVQGQDTRVYERQEWDNYQVSLNQNINVASMYAFDDDHGGWFRIATPMANDGYGKAITHPLLYPYQTANELNWIFTGIKISNQEWADTLAERDALR